MSRVMQCTSIVHCVAVCCSVLQCVAVCCFFNFYQTAVVGSRSRIDILNRTAANFDSRISLLEFLCSIFVLESLSEKSFPKQSVSDCISCVNSETAYRVAKTHRMPYLLRSFFAKGPYNQWLFCEKWPMKIRYPMGLRHPVADCWEFLPVRNCRSRSGGMPRWSGPRILQNQLYWQCI